jgi:hypothetical protein
MNQLEHLFKATVQGYQSSLYQHMPLSDYRNFNIWALSARNPHNKIWLQIVGIPQFAKLTQTLLGNSVPPEKWDQLVHYTTLMNAYLIYETISDNLAFGLAAKRPDDTSYDLRREILINFNNAMVARLKGDRVSSDLILARIKPKAEKISSFNYSLTANEQKTIAAAFLHESPSCSMEAIEFGAWHSLVANIQSCGDLVDGMQRYQLGDYLRQGLIRRYEAVNDLLLDRVHSKDALVNVSINTILVIPVLTYYISVLTEVLQPSRAIGTLIENGTLQKALEDAALMVRLLNDLGTGLVVTNQYHSTLLNDLYAKLPPSADPETTFADMLMEHSKQVQLMTRIRKDISFSEYNVSLHSLMTSPPDTTSLLLFGSNLVYYQDQYRQARERLNANLYTISQTLKTEHVSHLIYQFVSFHEHIYQQNFDEQAGDYATKPDTASAGS